MRLICDFLLFGVQLRLGIKTMNQDRVCARMDDPNERHAALLVNANFFVNFLNRIVGRKDFDG